MHSTVCRAEPQSGAVECSLLNLCAPDRWHAHGNIHACGHVHHALFSVYCVLPSFMKEGIHPHTPQLPCEGLHREAAAEVLSYQV